VVTDNAAVANLRDSTATNPRLMRWLLALNAHRIDYTWRSGAKHVVPDALSRGFDVPSDFVWEKNDDVDALCSMEEVDTLQKELCERWAKPEKSESTMDTAEDLTAISMKQQEERESYVLPGRNCLINNQKKDEGLKQLRKEFNKLEEVDKEKIMESGELFFVKDDILFRRVQTQPRYVSDSQIYKRFHVQVCVPKVLRRPFLYSLHGLEIAGHDGVERTRARLEAVYWWKTYKKDVKAWVSSCFYCQKRKPNKPSRQGLTGSLDTTRPFQVVGFDIVKLTKSESGNEYLLTMIDHFSRYPLAVAIPNRKIKTVVQALHSHLICVFGIPEALLSDQEKSFTSKVTEGLLRKLGIQKLNTSGYLPTGNSRCERFHRYLNASLTMFVNDKKSDWEDYIDSILFAYRTSMCTSTGFTPFELVFGRKATLPPDVVYTVDGKQIQEEYKRGVRVSDSIKEAYKMARERQIDVRIKNKNLRDKGRKVATFQDGCPVFLFDQVYDKQGAKKLQYKFSGPHIVVKQGANENLYWVQRCDKKELQLANVGRLIKANVYNSDLGEPLGKSDFGVEEEVEQEVEEEEENQDNEFWEAQGEDAEEEQHASAEKEVQIELEQENASARKIPLEGDIVVVNVAGRELHVEGEVQISENIEGRSFSVGQVLVVEGADMTLHWLGTYSKDPLKGEWKKSYVHNKDKRIRHTGRASGLPYDSWETAHWIKIFDIIGEPFQMLENNRLPESVVKQIIIWEKRQARKKRTRTWVTTDRLGGEDLPHTARTRSGKQHPHKHQSDTAQGKKS